jgi:DNA primase
MAMIKKDSLELLKQRIDLPEVIGAHVDLHRSGASFKARCPFHEEKTPSFVVQKGDSHYHCFGCGAHGDAISFLMGYLKMGFAEAIEHLAERFQVTLEYEESASYQKGPNKPALKAALEDACRFYHFSLLYSEEGREALHYLFRRGIDLDFIHHFQVGWAPKHPGVFQHLMAEKKHSEFTLEQAGLMLMTSSGRKRDFFAERITFPIRDAMGSVIGFSARKIREETYGGKYINTSETPLFKKSQVLFGLSYSRQRIAKERKAIVVEGQLDALRLIQAGFNFTVAGQGTAFGEGHVRELLHLGVNHVYLALDGDDAGQEATVKIGDLFQKKGVEVSVVKLPSKSDPDSFLKEHGPDGFLKLIEESQDYLSFIFHHMSKKLDPTSPSAKNECVQEIAQKIRGWEQPVMVHESLRKLSKIADLPEALISQGGVVSRDLYIKKTERVKFSEIDPHRILETDLLRWLFLKGNTMPTLIDLASLNLKPEYFRVEGCRRLFELYLSAFQQKSALDLLSLGASLDSPEDQILLSDIMARKVNLDKAEEGLSATIERILQREWMEQREAIKTKIQSGLCSDEEALALARAFDEIKKAPPQLKHPVA